MRIGAGGEGVVMMPGETTVCLLVMATGRRTLDSRVPCACLDGVIGSTVAMPAQEPLLLLPDHIALPLRRKPRLWPK